MWLSLEGRTRLLLLLFLTLQGNRGPRERTRRGTPFTERQRGDGCCLSFIPTREKRRKGPWEGGGSQAELLPALGRGRRRGVGRNPTLGSGDSGGAEPAGRSRCPRTRRHPGTTRALRWRLGGSPWGGTGRREPQRRALPAADLPGDAGKRFLRRVSPVPPGEGGRGASPAPTAGDASGSTARPVPQSPGRPRLRRGGRGCRR